MNRFITVQPNNVSAPSGRAIPKRDPAMLKALQPVKSNPPPQMSYMTPAPKLSKAQKWASAFYRQEKQEMLLDEHQEALARQTGGTVPPAIAVNRKVFVTNMPSLDQIRSSGLNGSTFGNGPPPSSTGGAGPRFPPPHNTAKPPFKTPNVKPKSDTGSTDLVGLNKLTKAIEINDTKSVNKLGHAITDMPGGWPGGMGGGGSLPELTMNPARVDIPTVVTKAGEMSRMIPAQQLPALEAAKLSLGMGKKFNRKNAPGKIRTDLSPKPYAVTHSSALGEDGMAYGRGETTHITPQSVDLQRALANPPRAGETLLRANPNADPAYFNRFSVAAPTTMAAHDASSVHGTLVPMPRSPKGKAPVRPNPLPDTLVTRHLAPTPVMMSTESNGVSNGVASMQHRWPIAVWNGTAWEQPRSLKRKVELLPSMKASKRSRRDAAPLSPSPYTPAPSDAPRMIPMDNVLPRTGPVASRTRSKRKAKK